MMGLNEYIVLARRGSLQLLFVAGSICVYCEHTGSTVMRLTTCDFDALTRALALLDHHSV